jgi:TolB-like protein
MVLFIVFAPHSKQSTRELREPQGKGPPMVAVLPFTSANQNGDDEFFADGMHNDLLTQLAKLQSLRVISSTSVQEFRGTEHNIRTIGKELGADVILEGSVQTAADQIHINAQLIDARSDEHLWAESYDRELSPANIFRVQAEIAFAIAEALHATLTEQDSRQLAVIPTENMAAYRAYHRAMQMRARDAGAPSDPEYVQWLEEAVELDPHFSRAWAELITALAFQNISGSQPEMTKRAEEALRRLQSVAPGSADYLIGQAAYLYYILKEYDRAHDLVSEAILMNPGDIQAILLRSWIERRQGNFNAMIESRRDARRLDPRNPAMTDIVLHGLLVTHQYDETWAEIEATSLESHDIEHIRNLLLFREHRDFKRLQESTQETCQLFGQPDCGWEELIGIRDYAGAWESLDWAAYESYDTDISAFNLQQIFTLWLMKDDQQLMQNLQKWQEQLDLDRDDSDGFFTYMSYLGAAVLAGAQDNAEEAEAWIQRLNKKRPIDLAERTNNTQYACRVLGMIEAVHATVKCIRDGLREPSLILPFLEPYLPFYDSLRDKPEFIEMLVEIDGEPKTDKLY